MPIITKRKDTLTHEYVVHDDGVEIVISSNTIKDPLPLEFDLYVWALPSGELGRNKLIEIVQEITGMKVKQLDWRTGNGHGVVWVKYEN
jgi:hypothetical protein